jgi:ABC-type uncharacterized transport system fused permease/ATPase subunit
VAFSVLVFTIEPMLFLSILAFAVFGTIMTIMLGKSLVKLNFDRLKIEADFRFSLIRIRENAESIAFFRGEEAEGWEIQNRFRKIISNYYKIIGTERNLDFFTTTYNYLTWILPILVIAPKYMAGAVELGVVQQATAAFTPILNDLSLIINSFEELSDFSASVGRLHQFVYSIQHADPDRDENSPLMGSPIVPDHKDNNSINNESIYKASSELDGVFKKSPVHNCCSTGITFRELPPICVTNQKSYNLSTVPLSIRNLCLYTPDRKRILFDSLTFELRWGQKLLITGPSGIGKSSLLRAIAGLWTTGNGNIERANSKEVYFLPQKPYCPIGSLRDQLLYPSHITKRKNVKHVPTKTDTLEKFESSSSLLASDERLLQILKDVGLPNLASRSDRGDPICGLDSVVDWGNVMSLGEQQRLAFARVLIHQPSLVIADESTSAMDVASEERMYNLISNLTYISVGHRPTLIRYHTKKLDLQKLNDAEDSLRRCNYICEDLRAIT